MGQLIIGHIKMKNIKDILELYLVAGSQDMRHLQGDACDNLLNMLEQALKAGISCFQFRDKGAYSLEQMPVQQRQLAEQCFALCRQYQVPFIVNDSLDLAVRIHADGIHLGQKDLAIEQALAEVKGRMMVGLSANNLSQLLKAQNIEKLDYLGIGPIFPTQSKADHSQVLGLPFLQQLKTFNFQKPMVAIGGIDIEKAQQIRQIGNIGVAVISAITQAKDINKVVKMLKQIHN